MTNIVGLQIVHGGAAETGDVVLAGGVLFASGGIVSNTTVSSGGFELVADELARNQGKLGGFIHFAGIAENSLITAGGVELVFSGGLVSNTLVAAGGLEVLEGPATGFVGSSEGAAIGTTVNGGLQIVFGNALDTTVNSGTQIVWSGGNTSGTTLNGKASFEFVVGTASNDVINGGTEFLVSGGFAVDAQVNASGIQVIGLGCSGLATDLGVGATQIVESGGHSVNTFVGLGATEVVKAGGVASSTFLLGGLLEVQSGGSVAPNFSADPGDVIFGANLGVGGGAVTTPTGGILQLDFSQGF